MKFDYDERFAKIFTSESPRILTIEDSSFYREGYAMVLGDLIPKAYIRQIQSREEYLDIEEIITKENPDVIFLDGNLRGFGEHSTYGDFGPNLISFIRTQCPKAVIFSVSTENFANREALDRGAHGALFKEDLALFVKKQIKRE